MPKIPCIVVDCNRTGGGAPPPPVTELKLQGRNIASYFQIGSGAANIEIEWDWSRRDLLSSAPGGISAIFSQTDKVTKEDLLHALPTVLGASPSLGASGIALFLADQFDWGTDEPIDGPVYGAMFDIDRQDGSHGVRQGCAVFLRPIWEYFWDQPAAAGIPAFQEAVAYIATHELGHAFNLWHTDDQCFMEKNPNLAALGACAFDGRQQSYLALAGDPANSGFVLPGPNRKPFGDLAPGYTDGDGSALAQAAGSDPDITLTIALSHEEFWTFEPVELDVELSLSKSASAAVEIPDEIDPGYQRFQIWITKPNGVRHRYQPQMRYCRPPSKRKLTPEKAFRRDIALGRQSGGYTFSMPGRYQIQVTYRNAFGAAAASNVVTCNVRPAEVSSDDWRNAKAIMDTEPVQRLLQFKRHVPDLNTLARLAHYADTRASPETAGIMHYAMGKAMMGIASKLEHASYKAETLMRAQRHLESAGKTVQIGSRRQSNIDTLLSS